MKFNLVGATPDPVVVAQIREQLGLNDPWWQHGRRSLAELGQPEEQPGCQKSTAPDITYAWFLDRFVRIFTSAHNR